MNQSEGEGATVIKLDNIVNQFKGCLSLLDNQLKQLSTLIIQVHYLADMNLIQDKTVSLDFFLLLFEIS